MKKIITRTRSAFTTKKIRSIFLGLLFLSLSGSIFSQPVFSIVGNGTTSNCSSCYPSPYGNFYWASRHQMFVTAAELTAAGVAPGANMLSVGFDIANLNTAPPHQNWAITIYTTTSANPLATAYMNTGAVSTSTIGTATGVLGWNQTPIAPFVWNGTDNIVIETCFANGNWDYNYSTNWTTNLTGTDIKTRFTYQDGTQACPASTGNTSTNTRPNIRFEWEFLTPCSGMPTANTVLTPTYQVCPNTPVGSIGLANSYTLSGLNYQWLESTVSNVGPFTPISGANGWGYSVPGLTTTTYYQAVITCTNGNQSFTTTGSPIVVSGITLDSVAYYEDFEGIGANNRLPNCSWLAPNLGGTVKTSTTAMSNNRVARSGSSFAFFELPSANNAMYTNGIWMEPGITYSAAVHYATEYLGYSNWTNLSILVGPNQNTTGLVQVASVSPVISGPYKLLSNTFTVPSAGYYYVAVRASGNAGSALYMSIDDLSVTIPCHPASGNAPNVGLSASTTTICAGDQLSMVGSGADIYAWSDGSTTSNIVVSPQTTRTYTLVGTSLLTGCSVALTQLITVNKTPAVFVTSNKYDICPGETANLTVYGDEPLNFAWTNAMTTPIISVSPTVTTTYSVIGTNASGCSSSAGAQVIVKPVPQISVISDKADVCAGDLVTLTGSGAVSYEWFSNTNSQLLVGNPVSTIVYASTSFTAYGIGSSGCKGQALSSISVDACVGISEVHYTSTGLKFYPNPTNGVFSIETRTGAIDAVEVTDISGRVILNLKGDGEKIQLELSNLASGIYYARVTSGDASESIRIIKN